MTAQDQAVLSGARERLTTFIGDLGNDKIPRTKLIGLGGRVDLAHDLRSLLDALAAAERERDEFRETMDQRGKLMNQWLGEKCAAESRNADLVEGLKPFAAFRLEGFVGEVLEVVPSSPDNPARRIEPIWTSHFRRARALVAAPGGEGAEPKANAWRPGLGPVNCRQVQMWEATTPKPGTCARCGQGPCPFWNEDRSTVKRPLPAIRGEAS